MADRAATDRPEQVVVVEGAVGGLCGSLAAEEGQENRHSSSMGSRLPGLRPVLSSLPMPPSAAGRQSLLLHAPSDVKTRNKPTDTADSEPKIRELDSTALKLRRTYTDKLLDRSFSESDRSQIKPRDTHLAESHNQPDHTDRGLSRCSTRTENYPVESKLPRPRSALDSSDTGKDTALLQQLKDEIVGLKQQLADAKDKSAMMAVDPVHPPSPVKKPTGNDLQQLQSLQYKVRELQDALTDVGFKHQSAAQELQSAYGRIHMLEAVVCSTENDNQRIQKEISTIRTQMQETIQTSTEHVESIRTQHQRNYDSIKNELQFVKSSAESQVHSLQSEIYAVRTDLVEREVKIGALQSAFEQSEINAIASQVSADAIIEALKLLISDVADSSASASIHIPSDELVASQSNECSVDCKSERKRMVDEIESLKQRPTAHEYTLKVAQVQTLRAQIDVLLEEADDMETSSHSQPLTLTADKAALDQLAQSEAKISELMSCIEKSTTRSTDLEGIVRMLETQVTTLSEKSVTSEQHSKMVETMYELLLKKNELDSFEAVELAASKDALERQFSVDSEAHTADVARLSGIVASQKTECMELQERVSSLETCLSEASSRDTASSDQLSRVLADLEKAHSLMDSLKSSASDQYTALEKLYNDVVIEKDLSLEQLAKVVSLKAQLETRVQALETETAALILERDHLASQITSLNNQLSQNSVKEKDSAEKYTKCLEDLRQSQSLLESQYLDAKNRVLTLETAHVATGDHHLQVAEKLAEMVSEKSQLEIRIQEIESERDISIAECERLSSRIVTLEEDLSNLTSVEKANSSKLATHLKELEEMQTLMEAHESDSVAKVSAIQDMHTDAIKQVSAMHENLVSTKSEKELLEAKVASIESELNATTLKCKELSETLASSLSEQSSVALAASETADQLGVLREEMADLKEQLAIADQTIFQYQTTLAEPLQADLTSELSEKLDQVILRNSHLDELLTLLRDSPVSVPDKVALLTGGMFENAIGEADADLFEQQTFQNVIQISVSICKLQASLKSVQQEQEITLKELKEKHDKSVQQCIALNKRLEERETEFDEETTLSLQAIERLNDEHSAVEQCLESTQREYETCMGALDDITKKYQLQTFSLSSLSNLILSQISNSDIESLSNLVVYSEEYFEKLKELLSKLSLYQTSNLNLSQTSLEIESNQVVISELRTQITHLEKSEGVASSALGDAHELIGVLRLQLNDAAIALQKKTDELQESKAQLASCEQSLSSLQTAHGTIVTEFELLQSETASIKAKDLKEAQCLICQNNDISPAVYEQLKVAQKQVCDLEILLEKVEQQLRETLSTQDTLLERSAASDLALEDLQLNTKQVEIQLQQKIQELNLDIEGKESLISQFTTALQLAQESIEENDAAIESSNELVQSLNALVESTRQERDQIAVDLKDRLAKSDLLLTEANNQAVAVQEQVVSLQKQCEDMDVEAVNTKQLVVTLQQRVADGLTDLDAQREMVTSLQSELSASKERELIPKHHVDVQCDILDWEKSQKTEKLYQTQKDELDEHQLIIISLQEKVEQLDGELQDLMDYNTIQDKKVADEMSSLSQKYNECVSELALSIEECLEMKETVTETENKLKDKTAEVEKSKAELKDSNLLVESVQLALVSKETEYEQYQSGNIALATEIDDLKERIKVLCSQNESLKSELDESIKSSRAELVTVQDLLEREKTQLTAKEALLVENRIISTSLASEIAELKAEMDTLSTRSMKSLQEVTVKLEHSDLKLSNTLILLEKATADLAEKEAIQSQETSGHSTALTAEIEDLKAKIVVLGDQNKTYESDLKEARVLCSKRDQDIERHLEKNKLDLDIIERQKVQMRGLTLTLEESTKQIKLLKEQVKIQPSPKAQSASSPNLTNQIQLLQQQQSVLQDQYNDLETAHQSLSNEATARTETIISLRRQITRLETRCNLFKAHLKQSNNSAGGSNDSTSTIDATSTSIYRKRSRANAESLAGGVGEERTSQYSASQPLPATSAVDSPPKRLKVVLSQASGTDLTNNHRNNS
ncbi:hypothetical protein BASA60_005298 [Batrachochytrium salamandrivorans]|nr:hypothetical protein BASA60_005298 [Batrachochytrium salamandrivorans]KAH9277081.1 hypothetical protein BASA83_000604 [Batrachochytrium salamandrivorans]